MIVEGKGALLYDEKGKEYIRMSLCVKMDVLKKVIDRLQSIDLKEI